jgi:hypothetical protein
MSAVIVDLALARAQRTKPAAAGSSLPALFHGLSSRAPGKPPFQFWTGASGTRYVHTIYNLFECPQVDAGNYILVKRHTGGQRTVLSIGRAAHTVASLNLADIRQRSAELGANEVHIHLLADSSAESCNIEADLRGSLVTA